MGNVVKFKRSNIEESIRHQVECLHSFLDVTRAGMANVGLDELLESEKLMVEKMFMDINEHIVKFNEFIVKKARQIEEKLSSGKIHTEVIGKVVL